MINIKKYNQYGYVIVKNYLSKDLCNKIKKKTKNLKSKIKIPFSNEALGYGDVRNLEPTRQIFKKTTIQKDTNEIINSDAKLSHFLLVNKAAWIGPEVEWHQEVFNSDIYAPGINMRKKWDKFVQVFIAIDDQDTNNGCLKVFKKSHHAGFLKYENIVNIIGSHKRRVQINDLNKISKRYKLVDIKLKKGDALFFNHLLVHGSTSNNSKNSRVSALLQFYCGNLKFKRIYFEKYKNFRSKFVKDYYTKNLDALKRYEKKLNDFRK